MSDSTIEDTAGGADASPEPAAVVTAAEAAELAAAFGGKADTEYQDDDTDTTESADDADTDPEDPVAASAKREAAKYRRKLRDAETTVSQLTGRLETLQRAEVERLASQHLTDPQDLWRDGGSLEQMLDTDGNVDRQKVAAAAKEITKAHPHWRRTQRRPDFENLKPGNGRVADTRVSWASVLAASD